MSKVKLHAEPPPDLDIAPVEITLTTGYQGNVNLRFLRAAAVGLRSDGWTVRISEHKEVEEVLE